MKKIFTLTVISLVILSGFSSCKKCANCYFQYESWGEVKQLDPQEYCGDELDEIEGAATVAGYEGEYICDN